MKFQEIHPKGASAKRLRQTEVMKAVINKNGTLTISSAAYDALGNPPRVRISVDTEGVRLLLRPTNANDMKGWRFVGATGATRRVTLRLWVKDNPAYVGYYSIESVGDGLALIPVGVE